MREVKATHPSVPEWSDYVRGLAGKTAVGTMREHLRTCAACRAIAADLSAVVKTAAADRESSVPSELTVQAKAIFRPGPALDWLQRVRQLAAVLTFDSGAAAGLPVGVRGSAASARQLSYSAGDYDVDLRVEPAGGGAPGTDLAGQVVRRGLGSQGVEGALVQVVARGKTLRETETNQFGEFLLSYAATPAGMLRIVIREDSCQFDLSIENRKRK